MATSGPKRPAVLAQWSRAPIPADFATGGSARRERFVGVVADAMRRPLPGRVAWHLRSRRLAVGAAVACLMLSAVGTGLARTGARSLALRISGLLRPSSMEVAGPPSRPASLPGPRTVQLDPSPLASCPMAAASAPGVAPAPAGKVILSTPKHRIDRPQPASAPTRSDIVPSEASLPGVPTRTDLADQNRLYARAMAARRRGDTAEALRALDEFVRTYPQALLAQDALVEQFRTLAETHDHLGAARAARAYLALYPGGFARDEARSLASEADR